MAQKRAAQLKNQQQGRPQQGQPQAKKPNQAVSAQQAAKVRTGTYTEKNGTTAPRPSAAFALPRRRLSSPDASGIFSSTKLFQAPQTGHLPIQ